MGIVTTRPPFMTADTGIFTAWDQRSHAELAPGPGVADRGSFKVQQRQVGGAGMFVDIGTTGVGLQRAWVRGSNRGGQGMYLIDTVDRGQPQSDAYIGQIQDPITANSSGNPRLDQVILEVLDQQHAGGSNLAQTRVLAGTPTSTATLATRDGAASLPASCILLADVIVANGAASIVTANIQDRRSYPLRGTIPPILTDVDAVAFEAAPGLDPGTMLIQTTAAADAQQAAALMYLPRRAANKTKIKLRVLQGATANTANSTIAIFDASMRLIVAATTPAAFGGTANQVKNVSFAIPSTTFEAGYYYVFEGNAAGTVSGSVTSLAVGPGSGLGFVPAAPNLYVYSATGGTTVPQTLTSFIDGTALDGAAAVVRLGVPMVVLSD